MTLLPKGALSHAELLVLRALAAPDTRWHSVTEIATATELSERAIRSALRTLSHRDLVTGPPRQPFPKWSITTLGDQALAQAEVSADVRLEEAL